MTVKSIAKDTDQLTLTLVAEFAASAPRVWQLWEDPRQLERWWGPPGYPATFVDHNFVKGGEVRYYMTSPDGDKYWGWWQIKRVDPHNEIRFDDGFGDEAGSPNHEMPVSATTVTIESIDPEAPLTQMTLLTHFPSLAAMEQLVEMGMEEGLTMAVEQIDEILEEDQP